MDYKRFYNRLFVPIEERIGPIDEVTLTAILGLDWGGPVSLCTVGYGEQTFVTYVTCELACREEQKASAFGRYELMLRCDDQDWAWNILTRIAQMSFDFAFGHGHTVDIGPVVAPDCPIQGLIAERFAHVVVDETDYELFQFHGVTRSELEYAMNSDGEVLLAALKSAGIYPNTSIHRQTSIPLVG